MRVDRTFTAYTRRRIYRDSTVGRAGGERAKAALEHGPLRHAIRASQPFPKASRTGRNYLAICETSVAKIEAEPFDTDHPRACSACIRHLTGGPT